MGLGRMAGDNYMNAGRRGFCNAAV
jgi:hypothetical protein